MYEVDNKIVAIYFVEIYILKQSEMLFTVNKWI